MTYEALSEAENFAIRFKSIKAKDFYDSSHY